MAGRYCNKTSARRPGGVHVTRPGARLFAKLLCTVAALAISVVGATAALAQTPPGTPIDNTAVGHFGVAGNDHFSTRSNTVRIVTVELRTPASVEILQYAPVRTDAEMVSFSSTDYSTCLLYTTDAADDN